MGAAGMRRMRMYYYIGCINVYMDIKIPWEMIPREFFNVRLAFLRMMLQSQLL